MKEYTSLVDAERDLQEVYRYSMYLQADDSYHPYPTDPWWAECRKAREDYTRLRAIVDQWKYNEFM